jgi:hypothetical protein
MSLLSLVQLASAASAVRCALLFVVMRAGLSFAFTLTPKNQGTAGQRGMLFPTPHTYRLLHMHCEDLCYAHLCAVHLMHAGVRVVGMCEMWVVADSIPIIGQQQAAA